MYTKFQKLRLQMSVCFIVMCLYCLGLAKATADDSKLDQRQLRQLRMFVNSDGTKPNFIEGFENEAIRTVIEQLKTETDVYYQARLLFTLYYSPEQIKNLDPKLAAAGEVVIREKLKSDAPGIRDMAVSIVADREKDAGLDLIAPLLNDPDESVRVTVADAFGFVGTAARITQLETVLVERARGLAPEQIKRDYVFRHGYASIEKLKQRWRQPEVRPAEVEVTPSLAPNTPLPSMPKTEAAPASSVEPIAAVAETPVAPVQRRLPTGLCSLAILAILLAGAFLWKRHARGKEGVNL